MTTTSVATPHPVPTGTGSPLTPEGRPAPNALVNLDSGQGTPTPTPGMWLVRRVIKWPSFLWGSDTDPSLPSELRVIQQWETWGVWRTWDVCEISSLV